MNTKEPHKSSIVVCLHHNYSRENLFVMIFRGAHLYFEPAHQVHFYNLKEKSI